MAIKGFIKQTYFDGRFSNDDLPTPLKKTDICGKDTRKNRFIIVYENDEEKKKIMNLLGIDGKKVIYHSSEVRK